MACGDAAGGGGAGGADPRAADVVADADAVIDQEDQGQGPEEEEEGADAVRDPGQGEGGEGVLHVQEEGVHVVPEDAEGDIPDAADVMGESATEDAIGSALLT